MTTRCTDGLASRDDATVLAATPRRVRARGRVSAAARGALAGGLLVGALTAEGRALASDHRYARLRYELDDAQGVCANEATFRARVTSRLGYDPFRADAPMEVRIRITARRARARADVALMQDGKPSGQRSLEDGRCEALTDTVASAVALALDPVAAVRGLEPTPTAVIEPPPPPSAPPTTTPPPPPPADVKGGSTPAPIPAPEEQPFVPFAHADGTVGFARAPAVLVGGRIGVGVRRGAFSAAAEAQIEATPISANITPHDRVNVTALSGALVPCGHFSVLEACGVLALGSVQAKALDVAHPEVQRAFFAVLGLRAGVIVPLSRMFALRAHGSLAFPLARAAYVIDGSTAFTTALVEASASAGAEVRFR
ncbi:Hypothetical protein A7982_05724 [Minicystis rosea]|nr:Hypothetical protein A7982_05724 [Minicystis rosea]